MTGVTADSRTDTDVDILSALDFEPVLACEHSQHTSDHLVNDAAAWIVQVNCPDCHHWNKILVCESGRQWQFTHITRCPFCTWRGPTGDYWVSIAPLDAR